MRALLVAILLGALAVPCYAYTPNVGDRAANIYGRDITSNEVVHLEDFIGKWVFIDFWASWCSPCVKELPNVAAKWKSLRNRDDFVVFSIAMDNPATDEAMNESIRRFGISYPVIYDAGGWDTVQAVEWDIHAIPATFLVNPTGTIVATNVRGEKLGPALDFFLNYDGIYMPIGLRTGETVNVDGSVSVRLELSNPRHTPLSVLVDYWHTRYVWAEDDPAHEERPASYDYIEEDPDGPELELSVEFDDFGDAVQEIVIPAVPDTHLASYYIYVLLPETEHLLDGEGLWVTTSGRVKLTE